MNHRKNNRMRGRNDHLATTRGQRHDDARCQYKEENRSRQKISPHFTLVPENILTRIPELHQTGSVRPCAIGTRLHGRALGNEGLPGEYFARTAQTPSHAFVRAGYTPNPWAKILARRTQCDVSLSDRNHCDVCSDYDNKDNGYQRPFFQGKPHLILREVFLYGLCVFHICLEFH